MKERNTDLRTALIQAGIDEINTYGANEFSARRVASACNVSTSAPYKRFKDKKIHRRHHLFRKRTMGSRSGSGNYFL